MARASPARTPTPGQLTLDDWAEMLNESRDRLPPGERAGDPKRPVRQRSNRAVNSEDRVTPMPTQPRAAAKGAPVDAPALLTTDEAANLLHVHPRTVQRLVERGELCAVHLGCAVRFDPQDLAGLVERVKGGGRAMPTQTVPLPARRGSAVSFADRLRSQSHEHRAAQA